MEPVDILRQTREIIAGDAPREGIAALGSYTVPTSRDLEDSDRKETRVYRLLPAES